MSAAKKRRKSALYLPFVGKGLRAKGDICGSTTAKNAMSTTTDNLPKVRRFHWGHGIALFFSSFVVFMLSMVYLCSQQTFDLVAEDYYEQELRYETRIQARQNAAALSTVPQIFWQAEALILSFSAAEFSDLRGEIYAFSPASRSRDRRLPLALDAQGQQTVSTSDWAAGAYDVQISFESGGKAYFIEQRLEIKRH